MDFTTFTKVAGHIIDTIEGGYYHPNMLKDGRIKDSRYRTSGETMFGIDRLNGGSINTSKEGLEFWGLIDSCNAANTWKWNSKGGQYNTRLRELAIIMIYQRFLSLSKLYLSVNHVSILEQSKVIAYHFAYACWNGSGWFKIFAENFKNYCKTHTDINIISELVIEDRTRNRNSLIIQSGDKIKKNLNVINAL